MTYNYNGKTYTFHRYPKTSNRSLLPMSAADELLLTGYQDLVAEKQIDAQQLVLLNDRFGVLASLLQADQPQFIATYASQLKAAEQNLLLNQQSFEAADTAALLSLDQLLSQGEKTVAQSLLPAQLGLMRIPKSLELFELYVALFAACAAKLPEGRSATLLAGFMTRHFSPALLKIAGKYATEISQSRAHKKARLISMTGFKSDVPKPASLMRSIDYDGRTYQQYYGVFSANHIDYATQFLLEEASHRNWFGLSDNAGVHVLDMACGNGVIGARLLTDRPKAQLTAVDDSSIATLSSKINLPADRSRVILDDGLAAIDTAAMDLVVTNPPFHFGYENNIEVSLNLFRQAKRVLKPEGQLIIVANRHLNYSSHLREFFEEVEVLNHNQKFEILRASPKH